MAHTSHQRCNVALILSPSMAKQMERKRRLQRHVPQAQLPNVFVGRTKGWKSQLGLQLIKLYAQLSGPCKLCGVEFCTKMAGTVG
jgi:hypothetical protein